ncbi:MAG: ATP-binding cassette domain-containing protein [Lachnospiraceae bacterium]|nr:ATP-binding cassette domain-containing protein [Lachnospiraceae bacterium]
MKEYAVITNGLTKEYGKKQVVNSVDMHIEKGDIYGFIGKNGAGKTTVMKMLCGMCNPSDGSYTLFGMENADEARKKIGSLIENPALFPKYTVKKNLTYYTKLKNISTEKMNSLLNLVGLPKSVMKKKAENLSLGMKQRLSIAIALMNDPELLILDEPMNGLDPEGMADIRTLLIKLNRERGITILISSHILGELEKIATRYGVIRDGVLVEEIEADELHHMSSGKMVIESEDMEKVQKILAENGITLTRSSEQSEDIEGLFRKTA